MFSRDISEDEVIVVIEKGELEYTKTDDKGRGTEYTHSCLVGNDYLRKIMVGYSYDGEDIVIHTVYETKRRWKS